MNDTLETIVYVVIITVALLIVGLQPAFEAHSYNKFVCAGQPHATYLDAAFSSLRVTNQTCNE